MKLNRTDDFERVTEDIRAKAEAAGLARIWHALSDMQRAQWVRPLMAVGHSNRTASDVLGVTSGKVAGIRRRHHIPSRNPHQGGRGRETPENPDNVVVLRDLKKKR